MEVLVVGNTAYVDDDFCAKAFPDDHVQVVAADDAQRESSSHSSWKELLRHLDQAYEFDRVVYLSTYLTPHTETFGDIGPPCAAALCCGACGRGGCWRRGEQCRFA